MKKIKSYLSFLLLILSFLAYSCSDIDSTQQEYLDRGEIYYVGKLDSLNIAAGWHRVEISGLMRYANTADKCIIKWGKDSLVVSLKDLSVRDTLKILVPDLPEGPCQFFVKTYDTKGNESLEEEVNGIVYGENFAKLVDAKLISNMSQDDGKLIINWSNSDVALRLRVRYESNGGWVDLSLPGTTKQTAIDDWKLNGIIEYQTAVFPQGALDTIYSSLAQNQFPSYLRTNLLFNKPVIESTGQYNWDFRAEKAIDGDRNTKWADFGGAMPKYFVVDMGQVQTIREWTVLNEMADYPIYLATDYSLQIKNNLDDPWVTVDEVKNNTAQETIRLLPQTYQARYIRLYLTKPSQQGSANIYEFAVY
jgi:hypothetical protein